LALVEQAKKIVACSTGAAVLIEQSEPSTINISPQDDCDFVAIQLPRDQVRGHERRFENDFMRPIPASSSALALARAYVETLIQHTNERDIHVARFAADHIADLVSAAITPDGLGNEQQTLDLRAARFETIRRELDRRFMLPGFSLTALARRLGVSPRYVQALFAEAETSFTDELTKRRLERAHEMLVSPDYLHLNITEVAHECGFFTVSHFHRIFRRQFKATPGEVRSEAGG